MKQTNKQIYRILKTNPYGIALLKVLENAKTLESFLHERKHVLTYDVLNRMGYDLIDYSFTWSSSKEGHDFWSEKDRKFRLECQKNDL